jgi:murein L,D-transpeptidase YcbB/YkuD
MAHADKDGLQPNDYLPDGLASFDDDGSALDGDDARLDLAITASVLRYAEHLYSGRIVPNKLSSYYDITPPVLPLVEALRKLTSPSGADYLASLAPSHPAYAAMKSELGKLRALANEGESGPAIAQGEIVKIGKADPRLPAVREELARLGYDAKIREAEAPEVLDKGLAKVLKAFQSDKGIRASGRLTNDTIKALNGDPPGARIDTLVLNMERLRWLPRNLGERHLFVNQAAFRLYAMSGGHVEWETKVIIGKPETQTAVFSDEMETVVLNPYWGVPKSILYYEMLPYLANDPYYLDRKGFEVINSKGRKVSSGSVDWWSYGENIPYDVRQRPGRTNALGNIKFLFPNSHDIYMHDTPAKKLFAKDMRAFSHGCVRVENPRELARFVLGWDRERIDAAIGTGTNREYALDRHIPVYLNYFTAWPTETGIAYYPDVYQRDARMTAALSAIAVAAKSSGTKLAVDEQAETATP